MRLDKVPINDRKKSLLILLLWAAAAVGLPLAGVRLTGLPLQRYLEFPPRTLYTGHASFSLLAFIVLGLAICGLLPLYFYGLEKTTVRTDRGRLSVGRIAPALALLALCWSVAWTRFGALSSIQHHTFVLVWGAYIVLVHRVLDGIGSSPFQGSTKGTFGLFGASAAFWWLFEWLNRFVQNWTYHAVDHFSPGEYWLFATLSFATVLPAVLVTKSLLAALFVPTLQTAKLARHPLVILGMLRYPALIAAGLSLFFLPKYPNELFALLWLAPLIVLISLCHIFRVRTFAALRTEEDFSDFMFWSIAGVWCGVLWEMWNFSSLAGWDYHIPYVGRMKIFAMPVLGYAGYLPFGLLCGLICEVLARATSSYQDAREIMTKR